MALGIQYLDPDPAGQYRLLWHQIHTKTRWVQKSFIHQVHKTLPLLKPLQAVSFRLRNFEPPLNQICKYTIGVIFILCLPQFSDTSPTIGSDWVLIFPSIVQISVKNITLDLICLSSWYIVLTGMDEIGLSPGQPWLI